MTYFILGVVISSIVLGALFLNKKTMYPRTWSYEDALERELNNNVFDPDEFESYPMEEVKIKSEEGHTLYGRFYDFGYDDTVVIVHGYTYNMMGAIKYMKMYIDQKFNVLMFDHRNHGKSGGNRTTFGYREKDDLKLWLDWLRTKKTGLIGTHGESMGAATVIQHAAIDERVSFVVADCPYKSVTAEFAYRTWVEYRVPPYFFLWLSSIFNFIKGGGLFRDISPLKVINDFETPLFLIHGLADDYIKPSHSEDLFEKRKYKKKLYLVPEAKHVGSIVVNKQRYVHEVHNFLYENKIRES